MAGHSKWANIKHQKAKSDAKKGKIFSRIAKEIIVAVKLGDADPKSNPRLRAALQKAREANVPNDVIDRNIKKATSADQANFEELTYELYGYGGVGILAQVLTDNKNRIASEMRIATNKRGGTIAQPGAVSFNFERKGIIILFSPSSKDFDESAVFAHALDAGASDFEASEEGTIITTEPADLFHVKDALEKKGLRIESAELEMVPKNLIDCDEETKRQNEALLEWLDGIDDVDDVFHNMST